MKWTKKGLIFAPQQQFSWMVSHASIPVVDKINDDVLRIYFSTRNKLGQSIPTFIDVEADNPKNIIRINNTPILPLGKLGTFDDSGIMPSWITTHENKKYLFYIGWNPQVTVSYRLSIGLAISEDNGEAFFKLYDGPICDRGIEEPYFNTAPCVLIEAGIWKMWYISCTKWDVINGKPEPFYHVKYAESHDGVNWKRDGVVCIDYDSFTDAIGRPCVYKEDGAYKMIYSYRSATDYRTSSDKGYRLGYAESIDGLSWVRNHDEVGIHISESGWDSEMMEYCYIYRHKDKNYLFYNGNGFGQSGIGYAEAEVSDELRGCDA